jgi:hypothetical protein
MRNESYGKAGMNISIMVIATIIVIIIIIIIITTAHYQIVITWEDVRKYSSESMRLSENIAPRESI